MAYEWQQWQDHVTKYENRYREIENDDGTITHEAVEGGGIAAGNPAERNELQPHGRRHNERRGACGTSDNGNNSHEPAGGR